MNKFDPLILGTQEGRQPQLNDLDSCLNNLNLFDEHREWIEERMYPTLFLNKDIKVKNSGDIWLSQTPNIPGSKSFDSPFPRLATYICTELEKLGQTLVINLHLDHMKESTRIEQAKVLANEIKGMKFSGELIVMGDFNSSPSGPVRKIIVDELDLYDPWIKLGKKEEASHHEFNGVQDGVRIDWILLSKNIKVKEIELYKESFNDIFPSDHFPVLCELDLKS